MLDATEDAHFLSYDAIDFIWCFKVEHFTKYGEDGSDSDEDETKE